MSRHPQTNYPKSLIEWGESGPFSPCLRPDRPSAVDLRAAQLDIKDEHPEAELTRDLILPFFYCDPAALFEQVSVNSDAKIDKSEFYKYLAGVFGNLIIGHANFSLDVNGIERGDDGSSVYAKLGRSANFDYLSDKAQNLLDFTLAERTKLSEACMDHMKEEPNTCKMFEKPEPRILIATSLGAAALSQVDLPKTLHFDEIGDGSSALHGSDNRTWYMKKL